ncbi:MAG: 4-(cytidine 5'-diphospho)-2-C-methyl-D-erythritol kinase [Bacilli bacterium]|nr:4-(cytidine 5'-diphospho)-2-C-methyl-D-erythritol kinase [Bacilli bacterium]
MKMKSLHIRSYAKINLCLNITGKREDGFHELDMIMLPISLHDSLIVSKLSKSIDNFVTVDDFSIGSFKYNLATFAIDKLQSVYRFDEKFRILIHKVIPIQAGLGGGSSNAACTMKAVNTLLNLGATEEQLMEYGKELGADIPFFVKCKPARCRGIGEIIDPIEIKNNYYVLLVKPEMGCSTREVYQAADTMDLAVCDMDKVLKALAEGDDDLLAESIANSLQAPAISLVPTIQGIIDELKDSGLKIVQMTGSGSAVFALSTDKKLLKKVLKKIENKYQVELAKVLK